MKKIIIFLLVPFFLPAQTLQRSVLPSAGSSDNPQLQWTLGEVATTVLTGSGYSLYQGFQQPIQIVAPSGNSQTIVLQQGWNLISSYIQPSNPNMLSILSPISGQIALVKDADGRIAIPSLNQNFIGNWDVNKGYQIKANNATNLTIVGSAVTPQSQPIAIKAGWQIIPYLRTNSGIAPTMLNSISGQILLLKNNSGQIMTINPSINTIGNLQTGQGYWLKSNGNGILTYPSN
jgi:hypothetical protein